MFISGFCVSGASFLIGLVFWRLLCGCGSGTKNRNCCRRAGFTWGVVEHSGKMFSGGIWEPVRSWTVHEGERPAFATVQHGIK